MAVFTSRPAAFNTDTTVVAWWTSKAIYLSSLIRVLLLAVKVGFHNPTLHNQGRPFIMRGRRRRLGEGSRWLRLQRVSAKEKRQTLPCMNSALPVRFSTRCAKRRENVRAST